MITVLIDKTKVITQQYEVGTYVAIYEDGCAIPHQLAVDITEVQYHKKLRKKCEWNVAESTWIPNKPRKVKAIYDNEGTTIDRYTIVLKGKRTSPYYECLRLSYNPDHPCGFSQMNECTIGDHLGKKIKFYDLPLNIILHIERRLKNDK